MGLLIGYENEKDEINQLKSMLLNADAYIKSGIRIPRGLVLFGKPGVGKTQLARLLDVDGINFCELHAASCTEEDAAEKIDELFASALENQPAVILLDELDKIAGSSDKFYMEENAFVSKILLQKLDSLPQNSKILVVATCNDTDCLGNALLRPGRFDRQISVDVPNEETRAKILEAYLDTIRLEKHIDPEYFARIMTGSTGAEIECLVNEVGIFVMNKGANAIEPEDMRLVMNKLAFKGNVKSPIKNAENLRKIAVHEAGHVMTAMILAPEKLFGATILPQGNSNGHINFVDPDDGFCTVKELEDEVVVLLGGHVAERVVNGEYNIGSGMDLREAKGRLSFIAINEGAYGYRFISGGTRLELTASDKSKNAYDELLAEKLEYFDQKAADIITAHRDIFDNIVDKLMEKQSLTKDEIIKCFPEDFDFPVDPYDCVEPTGKAKSYNSRSHLIIRH